MLEFKDINCPKCGKSHFRRTKFSTAGSTFDFLSGLGMNDCLFRKRPEPIYNNGKLENAEELVPDPTTNSFECIECGCNFSVKTTYKYNGAGYSESNEIIDDDKAFAEYQERLRKQREEAERLSEERAKKRDEEVRKWNEEHPDELKFVVGSDVLKINNDDLVITSETALGNGSASEIDLGGTVIHSDKTFTDEQINNIRETFGWEVKNNE